MFNKLFTSKKPQPKPDTLAPQRAQLKALMGLDYSEQDLDTMRKLGTGSGTLYGDWQAQVQAIDSMSESQIQHTVRFIASLESRTKTAITNGGQRSEANGNGILDAVALGEGLITQEDQAWKHKQLAARRYVATELITGMADEAYSRFGSQGSGMSAVFGSLDAEMEALSQPQYQALEQARHSIYQTAAELKQALIDHDDERAHGNHALMVDYSVKLQDQLNADAQRRRDVLSRPKYRSIVPQDIRDAAAQVRMNKGQQPVSWDKLGDPYNDDREFEAEDRRTAYGKCLSFSQSVSQRPDVQDMLQRFEQGKHAKKSVKM